LDDDFLLLGMRDIYLILVIFKAKIELNPEVNEFKTFLNLGLLPPKPFKIAWLSNLPLQK
jgi:hypothetical protein